MARRADSASGPSSGHGPLGDDDDGRELAPGVAPPQPLAHGVEVEGDLGDEDLGRAAGHAGMGGDPSGVATHHLADDDPVVRLGRRPQPVDGVGGDLHGGVEPEGDLGPGQVVVDRLRAHRRPAPRASPRRSATPSVSSPPMATRASTPRAARVATTRSGPPSTAKGFVRDVPRMVPPMGMMSRQRSRRQRHGVVLEDPLPAVEEADGVVAVDGASRSAPRPG